jgi:type IV pilus assembly protein PilX
MTTRKHNPNLSSGPAQQRGAALVTGLILLLILTIVAISGMNTATLELVMAGNTQFQENAFQAAETGIDRAIASRNFSTTNPVVVPVTAMPNGATFATTTTYQEATAVPSGGFSMGLDTGFAAYHFDTQSQGQAQRNAASDHNQSFYVVGPGAGSNP